MRFSWTLFFRTIAKDKFLTAAKVFGLAVGFLVFSATTVFVKRQLSFDTFHQKGERIYRLNLLGSFEEIAGVEMATSHWAMGSLLEDNYPEIENFVRLFDSNEGYVKFNNEKAYFDRALFADSSFFNVFDFSLLFGRKERILTAPNTVVISEEISRTLFGDENPVGKTVMARYGHWVVMPKPTEVPVTITGVIKTEPTSHLQFDMLVSISSTHTLENVMWSGPVAATYVLVNEGSAEILDGKLRNFYKDHVPDLEHMYQGKLQPLGNIHLQSAGIKNDPLNWQKFDRKYVDIFIVLAVVVLVVAAINFVQLSVGQLSDRFKSMAVRRLVGGSKWNIILQYYFETALLCIGAVIIATAGIYGLRSFILTDLNTNISIAALIDSGSYWIVLAMLVLIIAIVGLIPAAITQAITPIKILSGDSEGGGSLILTRILIVLQLALSFGFLGGAIVVYKQTRFLLDNNNSFEQKLIIQVPLSEEAKKNFEAMKLQISPQAGVEMVTGASNKFGTIGGLDLKLKVEGEEKILILPTLMVDPDFLRTFEIEVAEGRDFGEWGQQEFIINRTMAKTFGWDQPIGESLQFAYGRPGKVVGVVEDFSYNSLHEEVESFCFWSTNYLRFMSVKVVTGQVENVLGKLESVWNENVSDMPFSYSFVEDDVASMYKTEAATNKIVTYLTVIAVLLSSLGIYALSYIISRRKTREVSIRKVLGAPINLLFLDYSGQFFRMMLLALVLIAPITYLIMRSWLTGFAFKIQVPTGLLLGGIIVMVALSTLSLTFNLLRLVSTNPTKALREK